MRLIILFTLLFLFPAAAHTQSTWYVPDHFSTIQGAIDASNTGDTIMVRPGTYNERLYILDKALEIKSEMGPEATIIDGQSYGTVVYILTFTPGVDLLLEGFTIRNGKALPPIEGGGICCDTYSSATLKNNIIEDNQAYYDGGGIYIDFSSSVTISDNIIRGNTAIWGGGIYCCNSNPVIENNLIEYNTTSGDGGGLCSIEASPLVENNTFQYNTAHGNGGGYYMLGTCAPSEEFDDLYYF